MKRMMLSLLSVLSLVLFGCSARIPDIPSYPVPSASPGESYVEGEELLAALQFALDRHQGTIDLISVKVCDNPYYMREMLKGLGHAAAFVIDQDEGQFFRTETDSS